MGARRPSRARVVTRATATAEVGTTPRTALAPWVRPWQVAVVIPARNEEQSVSACLHSVRRAVWQLSQTRPHVRTRVVVVLDRCTDGTAGVVAGFPDVALLPVHHGCVGAARAAGVDLVARSSAAAADHVWVATTDADGEVPGDWLSAQLDRADRGAHAFVGTVTPARLDADVLARWHARHQVHEGHPHVHGANLGVRLDWYDAVGGFDPVEEHEDVRLVERLTSSGATVARTGAGRVLTSERTVGRTPGGFATYLRQLEGVA